jgi:hypothetical protein
MNGGRPNLNVFSGFRAFDQFGDIPSDDSSLSSTWFRSFMSTCICNVPNSKDIGIPLIL